MVLSEPVVLDERQEAVQEISSRRDGEVLGSEWGDRDTQEDTAGRGMQKKCMGGRMFFMYGYVSL